MDIICITYKNTRSHQESHGLVWPNVQVCSVLWVTVQYSFVRKSTVKFAKHLTIQCIALQ